MIIELGFKNEVLKYKFRKEVEEFHGYEEKGNISYRYAQRYTWKE